jgi:hypothetical protein
MVWSMATLLEGVNAVFKEFGLIAGVSEELSTLTDSERQHYIDVCVRKWGQAVDELYTLTNLPMPLQVAETTITLVDTQREYDLPAGLDRIRWPLVEETDGYVIVEHPGGFEAMRGQQRQPAQWVGLPVSAVISPITGKLRMNRAPTANEAGKAFKLIFDMVFALTDAADVFPFSESVFDAMVPVVNALLENGMKKESDGTAGMNFSRAARLLTKAQPRAFY